MNWIIVIVSRGAAKAMILANITYINLLLYYMLRIIHLYIVFYTVYLICMLPRVRYSIYQAIHILVSKY